MNARNLKLLILLALGMAACSHLPTPLERRNSADALAAEAGWTHEQIVTDRFSLRAYLPIAAQKAGTLTVYIEGDGLAWINPSTPSHDPTPVWPMSLFLALRDTAPVAYLARPCQYVDAEQHECAQKYWTSHRFSREVIDASNQAIDQLKQRFSARAVILVGYSGGGAVAALAAAERRDVAQLITVAGNLDHQAWTQAHHLVPLSASLNPADAWRQLEAVPQLHFVGGKDHVVEASVLDSYAARFPEARRPRIVVIPDFDHVCCWAERWPVLVPFRSSGIAE